MFLLLYYLKKYYQFFEATLSVFMADPYLEEQIVMYSIMRIGITKLKVVCYCIIQLTDFLASG